MWISAVIGTLFFQFAIFQMTLFNSLSSHFIAELGLSTSQYSTIASLYFYTAAFSLIPAGLWLDRGNIKRIICIIFAINLLALLALYFMPSALTLSLYRAFCGLSNSVAFLACMKIISRLFTGKKLSLANGLMIAFAMLGGVIPSFFQALLHHYNWHQQFFAVFIYGSVYLALIATGLNATLIKTKEKPLASDRQALYQTLKTIMRNPINWQCGFYTGLLNLPVTLLAGTWGNLYLIQTKHLSTIQADSIIGLIFIGMIIGSPMIGWLSTHLVTRKTTMIIGALSSLMLISLIMADWSLVQLGVLFTLLGIVITSQILSYPIVTESNSLAVTGAAMSFISVLIYLITASYSGLFGFIASLSEKSISTAFVLLPIAFIVAAVIALRLSKGERSTDEVLTEPRDDAI